MALLYNIHTVKSQAETSNMNSLNEKWGENCGSISASELFVLQKKDNHLPTGYTRTSFEITSELPEHCHCLLCNEEFAPDIEETGEDENVLAALGSLLKILKISNFEQLLGICANLKYGIPSRNFFCPDCMETVVEVNQLQHEIAELERRLSAAMKKVTSTLSECYSSTVPEPRNDFVNFIRTTLYQVTGSCRVKICRLTEDSVIKKGNSDRKSHLNSHDSSIDYITTSIRPSQKRKRKPNKRFEGFEVPPDILPFKSQEDRVVEGSLLYDSYPEFEDSLKTNENDCVGTASSVIRPENIIRLKETKTEETVDISASGNELSFACNVCGKSFPKRISLRIHQNRKHGVENRRKRMELPNKCQFCEKEFLESEFTTDETNKRVYSCVMDGCACGRKFGTFHHFKYHHYSKCQKRRENLENQKSKSKGLWVCELCGKKFEFEANLKYHQRSVHEQKFRYYCEICGHGTQVQSMLKRHMIVHSNEKSLKCEQCDYRCKRPSQMFYHKRLHTNERPHLCSQCGKAFPSNNKLQQHIASHATSKDFPCPLCDRFFACKVYVTNHINAFHKRRPRAHRQVKRQKKNWRNQDTADAVVEGNFPEVKKMDENEEPLVHHVSVTIVDETENFEIITEDPANFLDIS